MQATRTWPVNVACMSTVWGWLIFSESFSEQLNNGGLLRRLKELLLKGETRWFGVTKDIIPCIFVSCRNIMVGI